MSKIQLGDENEIDPVQIASASLEEKGAKISSKTVTVGSGGGEDLRVPEDSLIVRLKDGSEFIVRGEQKAKRAWDLLTQTRDKQHLEFSMNINKRA